MADIIFLYYPNKELIEHISLTSKEIKNFPTYTHYTFSGYPFLGTSSKRITALRSTLTNKITLVWHTFSPETKTTLPCTLHTVDIKKRIITITLIHRPEHTVSLLNKIKKILFSITPGVFRSRLSSISQNRSQSKFPARNI